MSDRDLLIVHRCHQGSYRPNDTIMQQWLLSEAVFEADHELRGAIRTWFMEDVDSFFDVDNTFQMIEGRLNALSAEGKAAHKRWTWSGKGPSGVTDLPNPARMYLILY